ncbi:MAG: UDP-N-acetylglucosamine 2-epimerase (non-hydrolyzing) [Bacteroidales bacterium]|nr:UDP-N-acetylglucosamine 2-epimerase (non-hydrolyzing) [Bacteroidales bacterium]
MIKILTVVGARPQIIKAAALSRAIRDDFSDRIEEKILHTGQHYDAAMSKVFFDELKIPMPDHNLGVGSGKHGEQTAKMISGIEDLILSEHFDGVVLYGDTNSTLAGAVAAVKQHIPIFHIEAGLRSFNMAMPEEVNRIACDQMSSILFAPTQTAIENLRKEGFMDIDVRFKNGKHRQIFNSGDVMYDNSLYFAEFSGRTKILESNSLQANNYILATIHRDNNTDNPYRLESIFRALLHISDEYKIDIILPLHPRTSKLMPKNLSPELYDKIKHSSYIKLVEPVSFLEMIELEKNAKLVMTDSGGVQKEAFFFEKPCVILRPETEWVEILEHAAGLIVDADFDRIVDGYRDLSTKQVTFPPLFGDGKAAYFILEKIIDYLE